MTYSYKLLLQAGAVWSSSSDKTVAELSKVFSPFTGGERYQVGPILTAAASSPKEATYVIITSDQSIQGLNMTSARANIVQDLLKFVPTAATNGTTNASKPSPVAQPTPSPMATSAQHPSSPPALPAPATPGTLASTPPTATPLYTTPSGKPSKSIPSGPAIGSTVTTPSPK